MINVKHTTWLIRLLLAFWPSFRHLAVFYFSCQLSVKTPPEKWGVKIERKTKELRLNWLRRRSTTNRSEKPMLCHKITLDRTLKFRLTNSVCNHKVHHGSNRNRCGPFGKAFYLPRTNKSPMHSIQHMLVFTASIFFELGNLNLATSIPPEAAAAN